MRNSVPAFSAVAVSTAALALLTVTTLELDTTRGSASDRPASSAAAHGVFREALATGTTVRTLDYTDPHANCKHTPSCG